MQYITRKEKRRRFIRWQRMEPSRRRWLSHFFWRMKEPGTRRRPPMQKHKWILNILIIAAVIIVLSVCWRIFRLEIIRATLRFPLPAWLKALIWGW